MRALRLWLPPLAAVAVVMAALLAISFYAYRANRAGAVALTERLMETLETRVSQEVSEFLATARRAALLTREVYTLGSIRGDQRAFLERVGRAVLAETPQVSLFMAADSRGNYLSVRRSPDNGTSTLILRNEPAPRRLTRIIYDAEGRVLREEPVEENNFDPRTRPWFEIGLRAQGTAWTDLYIFFQEEVPGLTVATPLRLSGGDAPDGVIALDISLRELSDFLQRLPIGRGSMAVIVDRNGRLVAHPDYRVAITRGPDGLIPRRLDSLDDPALARAYDRLRIGGRFRSIEDIGGTRRILVGLPLGGEGADGWRLVFTVPEESFIGYVWDNSRFILMLFVGVGILAFLLSLLLVRRGIRAEREARALREEQARVAAERAALAELGTDPALADPALPLPTSLTERLAEAAGARGASIWRLSADGRALILEDGHDRERGGHTAGTELRREELPAFFAALSHRDLLGTADAGERSALELRRLWLQPLGARDLLAVPVRMGARTLGVVWVEDPAPGDQGERLLRVMANLLATRFAGGAVVVAARRPPQEAPPPATTRTAIAEAALAEGAELAADTVPDAAVAALRLGDDLVLAGDDADRGATPLLARVAQELEQAAAACGVPYLRLLGVEAVAAAGLTPSEEGGAAPQRIARFALEARDRCARLFEEAGYDPDFRIGLDTGPVLATRLGAGAGFPNIWGGAARAAGRMAASAPPGGIQATEGMVMALSDRFLFRPRGAFHLPRLGTMNSYVLAAAL
jgi:adenylate cyclase